MSELLRFFKDMRDNGYGLAEIAAQLGTSAIAEPVAGFAAMYDPAHGADAIREGMTYQPRSDAAKMYQQGAAKAIGQAVKPAMPIIDTWKKGVDIAGQYSPVVGAGLRTVPTAIGIAMGAKPALQAGRQMSKGLESMQGRMIANANAPRTLNTGYMGQRGAVNVLNSVNPTGSVFVDYNPHHRANTPLAKNIVSYDKTSGGSPDELVTIYRGLPKNQKNINSGDFVTTNSRLARDYAGDGHVIKMTVKKSELLDDINEPLGEEYIYRKPQRPLTQFEQAHQLAQQNAALPVEKGGLGLSADNTSMDRARAMGFDVDNPVYHGTGADIDAFNTGGKGKTSGSGAFFTDNPSVASTYSDPKNGVLYPVLLNNGEVVNVAAEGANWNWLKKNIKLTSEKTKNKKALNKNLGKLFAEDFKYNDALTTDDLASWANNENYDAIKFNQVKDRGPQGVFANQESSLPSNNAAVFNPKNIRSRFAAFDPFNRESSNLLATTAPLVPTTALGAYMYNEKRKKSQGNQ